MEGGVEAAQTVASWDWGVILQIIGGAGLGSAIAQYVIVLLRDRRQSRSAATYLALRIAVTLEAYAVACARLIQENRYAVHLPEEAYPEWQTRLPSLGAYPDDADGWRAVDSRLADAALSFPARLDGAQRRIYEEAFVNPGGVIADVEDGASVTGRFAWETAARLRKAYSLPDADPDEDPRDAFCDGKS